jgi:hypothetical protein
LELEAVGSYGFDGRNSYVAEQFDNAHGYLDISVTDDGQTLKGAFYSNSGSTRDSFIIKKTQDPVPEPIEKDFSLTVNPATLSIQAGNTATSTIQVAPLNGFNSPVTLSSRSCKPDHKLDRQIHGMTQRCRCLPQSN